MGSKKSGCDGLNDAAIKYINELAKQSVYGYVPNITSKYMDKGIIVEQDSINLINDVFMLDLKKNDERRENEWLTGTCDVFDKDKIYEIKSSWSLETFPATPKCAVKSDYEWQCRAYMMLWDVDVCELCYCIVSTPDELIGYDNDEIHKVDHISKQLRVTSYVIERDSRFEDRIKENVLLARDAFNEYKHDITKSHMCIAE